MKIFISFDMEGVAGIVDWSQCIGPGPDYDTGCRLLLGEVNAAIDGAMAAGADEIICNDSHGTMNNLDPEALHGWASPRSPPTWPRSPPGCAARCGPTSAP